MSDRKQVEHTHLHCFHWKIHFTYSKINLILSVNAPYYNVRRCSEVVFKWSSLNFQNKVGEKEQNNKQRLSEKMLHFPLFSYLSKNGRDRKAGKILTVSHKADVGGRSLLRLSGI